MELGISGILPLGLKEEGSEGKRGEGGGIKVAMTETTGDWHFIT